MGRGGYPSVEVQSVYSTASADRVKIYLTLTSIIIPDKSGPENNDRTGTTPSDGVSGFAILNKSWRQHPTRHQLYDHLPPITKSIQVRRTRHAGHCWRSRDELIRDVLLWTPTHSRAKAGRPAWTYIQQLCEDTGCCPEDLPRAMNDREEWRERVRDIRATSATWWWLLIGIGVEV